MRIRRGPARGMRWIAGSAIHGCWLGTYELKKQQALERFVRPGMTVYDVGANAGFYTLFFSRLVGDMGRVFAFEPCPYVARFLVDHVRMNRVSNVRVIQAAMARQTGLIGMSTDRGFSENQISNDGNSALMVPSLSLDTSSLPAPDLIKMDVEGAESEILRGAYNTLRKTQPVVFVALHGSQQREECPELFREAGYAVYDLDGQLIDGISPVDEICALPANGAYRA
jgi:FkbM family methyltransferase